MPTEATRRPNTLFRNLNAKIASLPMILTALVVFVGGTIWTITYSFTNSRLLPRLNFIGLDQYERLWSTPRWIASIQNLVIYGSLSLIFSLLIGFVLGPMMEEYFRRAMLLSRGDATVFLTRPGSAALLAGAVLLLAATLFPWRQWLARAITRARGRIRTGPVPKARAGSDPRPWRAPPRGQCRYTVLPLLSWSSQASASRRIWARSSSSRLSQLR